MEQAGVSLIAQGASAFGADMKNAEKAVDAFGAATAAAAKKADLWQDAAGRWRTASGRFASDAEKAAAGVEKIGPAATEAAKKTHDAGGRISAAGQVMIGALRKVGEVAVEAFGQALRAGAAFIGDSIKLAGDFEQTMDVLRASTGATTQEMDALSAKAKALGSDLSLPATSADDAGRAMLELSKGGFNVQQTMDSARGTLLLVAAAQLDEAKAAEITTNAINMFNLEAKDSVFVTDLLAAAANESSLNAVQVADTYNMAGSVFASFQGRIVGAKQAMIDLTTASALLGNAGIKGSDAGTSLKQSLLQLTGPSMNAKDQMKALMFAAMGATEGMGGLDEALTGNAKERGAALNAMKNANPDIAAMGDIAYDASGKMRPFREILGLTAQATKGMTDEMRDNALTTIFGADAIRVINELIQVSPDEWDKMEAAITKEGAAAEMAAAQTEGYKGAIEGAKSQIETLQLTLADGLLPILADLLNTYISPGIATFTKWAESILGANDPLLAFVQSVDSALPGLGSIIGYIAALIQDGDALNDFLTTTPSLFQDLVSAIDAAIPVVQTLTNLFIENIDIVAGLAAAFGAFSIISTVVGWVSGLIGTITALSAAFTAAGGGIAGIVAILGGPVTLTIAAVVAAVTGLAIAWNRDFLGIRTSVTQWWNDTLKPAFQQVQQWMAEKIPPAIKALADFWTGTLQPALKEVWGFLQDKIFPVLDDLVKVYIAVAKVEIAALAALWSNILWPALKLVGSFISGVILPIWGALFNVAFAIAKKEVEILAGFWQKVLWPALQKVGDYINTTIIPTFNKISDYLSATFGPILEKVAAWLNKVTGGFTGVSNAVSGVIEWLNGLATSISNLKLPSWLTPGSPTPLETGLRGIGDALQKSAVPGFRAFTGELATIGESFADNDLVDQLSQLGEDIMEGLGDGIRHGLRGVVRIIDSTSDTVTGAFQDGLNIGSPSRRIFNEVGVPIMTGLMEGIESMVPGMVGVIDMVGNAMIAALTENRSDMSTEINALMADLKDQATSLGMDINGAIADAFGSTASIERQIAKNLDRFKDVPEQYRAYTEGALKEAQQQATQFLDPAQQAKFFKMRSDQILEYAKLQKELDEETDSRERQRIQEKMLLINSAQQNEIKAFRAEAQSQLTPMQQIQEDLQKFLATNVDLSNGTSFTLPGLLENSTINGLTALFQQLSQLSSSNPYFESYANPPMYYPPAGGNTTTSVSNQRTYNMPIYTNNTPAALQQSMAITEAMYP